MTAPLKECKAHLQGKATYKLSIKFSEGLVRVGRLLDLSNNPFGYIIGSGSNVCDWS